MPEYDTAFDPEADVQFDSSDFGSEEEANAPEYAAEGIYHVVVQQVDASGKNAPGAVFLTFEILTGNVAGQEGKTVRLPIWPPHPQAKDQELARKRWKKMVLRLMLALGIRKVGEFPKLTVNATWWQSLEGRQCMARISHQRQKQKSESGKDVQWTNAVIAQRDDLFAIGSEDGAGVPISADALVTGGYALPGASTEEI